MAEEAGVEVGVAAAAESAAAGFGWVMKDSPQPLQDRQGSACVQGAGRAGGSYHLAASFGFLNTNSEPNSSSL